MALKQISNKTRELFKKFSIIYYWYYLRYLVLVRYTWMPFRATCVFFRRVVKRIKRKKKNFPPRGHGERRSRRLEQRQEAITRAQTATTLTYSGCPRSESDPGLGPRRTCVSAWCRSRSCLAAFLYGWVDPDYSSPR